MRHRRRPPKEEPPSERLSLATGELGISALALGRRSRSAKGKRYDQPQHVDCVRIVHLLRHSLDFVSWKDRRAVAAALKDIYRALDPAAAEAALAAFEAGPRGRKYAAIGQSWRRAWGEVVPFYAFPAEVRRILYTTNAIEALNAKLRSAVRTRGHFPTDEAALKLLYLVLNRTEKEWTMPAREWSMAKAQFAVLFGDRFNKAIA